MKMQSVDQAVFKSAVPCAPASLRTFRLHLTVARPKHTAREWLRPNCSPVQTRSARLAAASAFALAVRFPAQSTGVLRRKALSEAMVTTSGESDLNHSQANQNPAQASSKALVEAHLSVELLRSNPDKIYVFGDNLLRRGTAGQAAVRGEPNAFGIPTKRAPSMVASAFFSDRPDEVQAVLQALRELYVLARTRTVVFPAAGLGTGLARMASSSPKAYQQMRSILSAHFGFDQ